MTIDTLGYVKRLTDAGVDRDQAEAHVEGMRDHVLPDLATQQDIKDLRADIRDLKADRKEIVAELKLEIWRAGVTVMVAAVALITIIVKLT